jgi:hypothetical protein
MGMPQRDTDSKPEVLDDRRKLAIVFGGLAGALVATIAGFVVFRFGLYPDDFNSYGTSTFLLTPVAVGFVSAATARAFSLSARPPTYEAAAVAVGMGLCLFLLSGFEGIVCMVMAAAIVLPAAFVGVVLEYCIHGLIGGRANATVLPLLLVAAAYDAKRVPAAAECTETTDVVINAPAEKIWPYLFNLSGVEDNDPLLRLGFAHPTSVWTNGNQRFCNLTTGSMPEVVEKAVPDRLLQFKILNTPPSMVETNPFHAVHAPHVNGYYQCETGSFYLTPLGGGRTLLQGVSTYRFRIYPAPYWRLWTDSIVEHVHRTVMNRIKELAESPSS